MGLHPHNHHGYYFCTNIHGTDLLPVKRGLKPPVRSDIMVSEQATKFREYHQVRDQHAGNKINSQDDLIIQAIEILQAHPEGLALRGLISELIPYEGQYHIPLPSYLGRLLSKVRGTFKEGNKWKYVKEV